jgi:endoribonuclease Dicer
MLGSANNAKQGTIDDFIPRVYQEELADIANDKNTIAYLDTGAGKTEIAVRLLHRRLAQKQVQGLKPRFLSVFLAPRVALVHQQAQVLERRLAARVKPFIGETTEHWWTDPMTGRAELGDVDVAVMTPQVLVNALHHAVLKDICELDTIVLDEAHHCRKKDPSNVLMALYRQAPRSQRPRVLGLTAAPAMASNKKGFDVVQSLQELEGNLCASVVTVADRQKVEKFVPPVALLVERYQEEVSIPAAEQLEDALRAAAEHLNTAVAAAE